MPLYQPSNITPSTFAGVGGGTVDAESNIVITWQVNGNVPMTGFKIDFYTSGAGSTLVYTTGNITSGYGMPFYGVDANGDPVFFTYYPGVTYASVGLSNGNEYKFIITQYWGGLTDASHTVVQFSDAVFITRQTPTLSIDAFGGTVGTVGYTFTATFAQEQGDTINTVEWILTDNTTNEVVKDTGAIRTPILSFTFEGFLNGHTYALSCTVQTESGVVVTAQTTFDCAYTQTPTVNEITLSCAGNGGVAVTWGKATDIPGEASDPNGYSITADILHLDAGQKITWDTVDGEPMQFAKPYTVSWRGVLPSAYALAASISGVSQNTVKNAYLSPDGTKLAIIVGTGAGIYDISNGIVYLGETDIYANATTVCGAWTTDGSKFVVGGGDGDINFGTAFLDAYTVAGSVTLAQQVASGGSGAYTAIGFSADGTKMYASSGYIGSTPKTKIFDYSGGTFTDTLQNFDTSILKTANSFVEGILCAGEKMVCFGRIKQHSVWICLSSTVGSPQLVDTLTAHENVYFLYGALTGDGARFAMNNIYAGQSTATLYDLSGGTIAQIQGFTDASQTRSVSVSADGSTLSIGNRLYGWSGAGARYIYYGDTGANAFCVLSADASVFVSIENPRTVKLFAQTAGDIMRAVGLTFAQAGVVATLTDNNSINASVPLSSAAVETILYYRNDAVNGALGVFSLDADENAIYMEQLPTASYATALSSVVLYGEQTADFVHISTTFPYGNGYTPSWGTDTLFYARFVDDLQAGTISDSSSTLVTAIYRKENGKILPLLRVPTSVTEIIDYGVRSGQAVGYTTYYVDDTSYSAPTTTYEGICLNNRAYYLYECTQDANNPDVYHVQNIFAFGSNAEGGLISNNNLPNYLDNFTRYPTRQPAAQMPKSGVLSAMLSNVENAIYADSATQQDALFELSASTNTFFLKDKKGNLYMVGLDGAITEQQNDKSATLEVTVSIPWREIGDAQGKSVIQTPLDANYGQGALNGGASDSACAVQIELQPAEEVSF